MEGDDGPDVLHSELEGGCSLSDAREGQGAMNSLY